MNEEQKTLPARERKCYRRPDCDIFEDPDNFYILMDCPGVNQENLDVTYENESLSIAGDVSTEEVESYKLGHREYRNGSFKRSFSLPEHINVEGIEAKLKNGELTLTLPKSEAIRPRKIEVSVLS